MACCSHCGQETGFAFGTLSLTNEIVVFLCHPSDPDRPDCYRRVTTYHETLGVLRNAGLRHKGVEHIYDGGLQAARFITQFGEEFPTETTVCLTHKRFIPCRSRDGLCSFSSTAEDVNAVMRYHLDEG